VTAGTHRLIAKHAVMFAREAYEAAAVRSDAFYRTWPDMDAFCRKNWPMFVPDVRQVFVEMLRAPDEDHPDWSRLTDERRVSRRLKAEICEALCYDGAAKGRPE
jgi:hypothetical protein